MMGLHSRAQEFDNDARLWLYVKLNKSLNNKLKAQLILQNRLDNNISEYGQFNLNPELNYKLFKGFRLTGGYVVGKIRNLDASYATRHQAYAGFSYKWKWKQLALTYRNLVQVQAKSVLSSNKGEVLRWYERNKLTLSYQLNRRLEAYLAQELNSPFYRFSEMPINRFRSFVGASYKLSTKSEIEGYFMLQTKSSFKSRPNRDFVYGITYVYNF